MPRLRLGQGECHYRWDGPEDGDTLLLIHGATVPGWLYDRLVPYLVDAGFRTLRPDLYGHGRSARPRVAYGHELFVGQLRELLDALEVGEPIGVMGHSMGGAIAARLAASVPDRVRAVLLTAPLLAFTRGGPLFRALRVPLLGEALIPTAMLPMLRRRRRRKYGDIEDGRFVGKFNEQLAIPGYGRALLSLIRHDSIGSQHDGYRALAKSGRPVRILYGTADTVVTPAEVAEVAALLPRSDAIAVEGAEHSLVIARPERIAPHVIEFLGPGPA